MVFSSNKITQSTFSEGDKKQFERRLAAIRLPWYLRGRFNPLAWGFYPYATVWMVLMVLVALIGNHYRAWLEYAEAQTAGICFALFLVALLLRLIAGRATKLVTIKLLVVLGDLKDMLEAHNKTGNRYRPKMTEWLLAQQSGLVLSTLQLFQHYGVLVLEQDMHLVLDWILFQLKARADAKETEVRGVWVNTVTIPSPTQVTGTAAGIAD